MYFPETWGQYSLGLNHKYPKTQELLGVSLLGALDQARGHKAGLLTPPIWASSFMPNDAGTMSSE